MFKNLILSRAVEDLKKGVNLHYWGDIEDALRMLKVFEKAGIDNSNPACVYATIKTGRMLTAENMKLLTKAELREWNKYTDEYARLASEE